VFSELASLGSICEGQRSLEILVAQDESQREKIWSARRVLSTALRQLKPFKLSEDIAVPRSKIAETIAHFKEIGVRMGLTIATYGHAGDGNLHANILFERPDQRPIVEEAIEQILRFTVGLGGTITGEHGVGFSKRAYLPMEQPLELIELQRRLKDFFDPSGILNPGKIFLP
jgi:glycolate oxidase